MAILGWALGLGQAVAEAVLLILSRAIVSQPTVLELLSTAYRRLFDRALEVFARKDPVRAVWLFGSLASDRADEASDLDFQLAVSDSHFEGFAADWRSWLARSPRP